MSEESKDDDEFKDNVKIIGNEIYFMGEINEYSILDFIGKFKKLEIELLKKSLDIGISNPTCKIHICSDGGDLFAGFMAMDVIRKSKLHTVTVAHGACCSAATFLLIAGKERLISRSAHILIHQISTTEMWCKYEELKDELEMCNKLMKTACDEYLRSTKIPEKKLNKLMKRDIYLTPEECIKYNVVDDYE